MRNNILKMAASLLACGLDPEKTVLFQQSRVTYHANLMYILGSLQTVARLTRMPQYKDKAAMFVFVFLNIISGFSITFFLTYTGFYFLEMAITFLTSLPSAKCEKVNCDMLLKKS